MKDVINNFATGDKYEFLHTDQATSGRISEFVLTLAPNSSCAKSPRHFHPFQTETFRVLEGKLNLSVGDRIYELTSDDDKVTVEKDTLHSFWNSQNERVKFVAEIYPPVNIEKGIRLTCKLSEEGKISKRNIPYNPFYTLILMDYFDAYFSFIPWKIQKFIFRQDARLGKLFV